MSCLPFVKHLKQFGRTISKMALKIKTGLKNKSTTSYKLPFLDSEIDNFAGSYYSNPSPKLYDPPTLTSLFFDDKPSPSELPPQDDLISPDNALSAFFETFCLADNAPTTAVSFDSQSPTSSVGWEQSIDSLFDPTTRQFHVFEDFVQSTGGGFSDCSTFSYSPLSSIESIPPFDSSYNDLYVDDFKYRMQQECIRREFEMNGTCIDDVSEDVPFQPTAMSTPFVDRKSDTFKLSTFTSSLEDVKENYVVPFNDEIPPELTQSDNTFLDMIRFDQFPPPFIPKPLAQYNNNAKIQGRKRSHHQPSPRNSSTNFHKIPRFSKKKKEASGKKKKSEDYCVFCKNNGAEEILYKSHTVKDSKGRVLCPKLRAYQCPICGQDGDNSHTMKYCPMKPIVTMEDLKKFPSSKRYIK